MKDYDHQGLNGYIELDGRRVIFSRDGFLFHLLYDKVGAETSECTMRLKNSAQYIFGKTQEDHQIAILTGEFECFSYAPCSIHTSFYMIGSNNVTDTTIDKYSAIEFIGGSLDLLYRNRTTQREQKDDKWLLTFNTFEIESSLDYNDQKCKVIIDYAPSGDSSTGFAVKLRFEFETERGLGDLQTYTSWAYRLTSFLLNRQNVGFDKTVIYSCNGQFGDGWYPVATCYIKQIIQLLTDHAALDSEAKQQTEEANVVAELIRKCVAENATNSQDQEAYLERYKGLKVRYEVAAQRLKQIEDQRTERKQRRQKMLEFIRMLEHIDGLLTEFDEGLWNATVERVIVQTGGSMVFRWKNGAETTITGNCG